MHTTHTQSLSLQTPAAQAAIRKYKLSQQNKKALEEHFQREERANQKAAAGAAGGFVLGAVLIAVGIALILFA